MARDLTSWVIAVFLLVSLGQALAERPADPAITLKLDRLVEGTILNASPVFLSDDVVAFSARSSTDPGRFRVFAFRLKGGTLRSAGEITKTYEGDKLFSASNGHLLVAGVRTKLVYGADFREHWDVPMKALCKLFPKSDIVGEGGAKGEKVFRLTTPPVPLRRGVGELYAVSAEALVFGTEDAIRTELPDGTVKGSIPLNPGIGYFNNVEVAGPGRLYFSLPGEERISDLNGKTIVKVYPPDGWGFRHGWSSDGSRMVFDHYLRASIVTRGLAWMVDILGSVLPEQPRGEVIRVIDVLSGNTCLNLESAGTLFGEAGEYHADLSPSGRLVAVTTLKELRIYMLPPACPGNAVK